MAVEYIMRLEMRIQQLEFERQGMTDTLRDLFGRVCRLENLLQNQAVQPPQLCHSKELLSQITNRIARLENLIEPILRREDSKSVCTCLSHGRGLKECDGGAGDVGLQTNRDSRLPQSAGAKIRRVSMEDIQDVMVAEQIEPQENVGASEVGQDEGQNVMEHPEKEETSGAVTSVSNGQSVDASSSSELTEGEGKSCKIKFPCGHICGKLHPLESVCPLCTTMTKFACGHETLAVCHLAATISRAECVFCAGLDSYEQKTLRQERLQKKIAIIHGMPRESGDKDISALKRMKKIKKMVANVNKVDLSFFLNEIKLVTGEAGTEYCVSTAKKLFSKIVTEQNPMDPEVGSNLLQSLAKEAPAVINRLVFLTSSRFKELFTESACSAEEWLEVLKGKRSDSEGRLDKQRNRLTWLVINLIMVNAMDSVQMKEFVERLIGFPNEKNIELLCSFLEVGASKLHGSIDKRARNAAFPDHRPSVQWLKGLYNDLARISVELSDDAVLRCRVMNAILLERQRCGDSMSLSEMDFPAGFVKNSSQGDQKVGEDLKPSLTQSTRNTTHVENTTTRSLEASDSCGDNYVKLPFRREKSPSQTGATETEIAAANEISGPVKVFALTSVEGMQDLHRKFTKTIVNMKKKRRERWLKEWFRGCTSNDIDMFLLQFPYYVLTLTTPKEFVTAAELLRNMASSGVTARSRIIDGFAHGIVADLTSVANASLVRSDMSTLAHFLMELFSGDSNLDWLVQLGRFASKSNPDGWLRLGDKVIDVARCRYKKITTLQRKWNKTEKGRETICSEAMLPYMDGRIMDEETRSCDNYRSYDYY